MYLYRSELNCMNCLKYPINKDHICDINKQNLLDVNMRCADTLHDMWKVGKDVRDSTNVQLELNILFQKNFEEDVKMFLKESFGHDKILSKIEPNVNSYYEHYLHETLPSLCTSKNEISDIKSYIRNTKELKINLTDILNDYKNNGSYGPLCEAILNNKNITAISIVMPGKVEKVEIFENENNMKGLNYAANFIMNFCGRPNENTDVVFPIDATAGDLPKIFKGIRDRVYTLATALTIADSAVGGIDDKTDKIKAAIAFYKKYDKPFEFPFHDNNKKIYNITSQIFTVKHLKMYYRWAGNGPFSNKNKIGVIFGVESVENPKNKSETEFGINVLGSIVSGCSVSTLRTLIKIISNNIENNTLEKNKEKVKNQLKEKQKDNLFKKQLDLTPIMLWLIDNYYNEPYIIIGFLCDYKRAGDYEQVNSVNIIKTKHRDLHPIFCTGDELCGLRARYEGLNTVWSHKSTLDLFRSQEAIRLRGGSMNVPSRTKRNMKNHFRGGARTKQVQSRTFHAKRNLPFLKQSKYFTQKQSKSKVKKKSRHQYDESSEELIKIIHKQIHKTVKILKEMQVYNKYLPTTKHSLVDNIVARFTHHNFENKIIIYDKYRLFINEMTFLYTKITDTKTDIHNIVNSYYNNTQLKTRLEKNNKRIQKLLRYNNNKQLSKDILNEQYNILLLEYKENLNELIYLIIYDNLTFETFHEVRDSETMQYFNDIINSIDFKNQVTHAEFENELLNAIIKDTHDSTAEYELQKATIRYNNKTLSENEFKIAINKFKQSIENYEELPYKTKNDYTSFFNEKQILMKTFNYYSKPINQSTMSARETYSFDKGYNKKYEEIKDLITYIHIDFSELIENISNHLLNNNQNLHITDNDKHEAYELKFIEMSAIFNWFLNDIFNKYHFNIESDVNILELIYYSTNCFDIIEYSYDNKQLMDSVMSMKNKKELNIYNDKFRIIELFINKLNEININIHPTII